MTALHDICEHPVVLNDFCELCRQIILVAMLVSRFQLETLLETHFPASDATDGRIQGGGTEMYCQI